MSRMYLARHGQTIWHAENRYAGTSDIPLDETGRAQAERLAAWARGAGLAAIRCSTLARAVATAETVARATGLPLLSDERLVECAFGAAEGRTLAEMEAEHPEAAAAFRRDPALHPWPGGEEPHAVARRMVAALREMALTVPGPILVVSHNTALRLALCELLGLPISKYRNVFPALRNAAISEISLIGQETALLGLNQSI